MERKNNQSLESNQNSQMPNQIHANNFPGTPKDVKMDILKLLLEFSNDKYKNSNKKLYNPDLSLTILRFCYDFARYDIKKNIDINSLMEGVAFDHNIKYINDAEKTYFNEKILKITK